MDTIIIVNFKCYPNGTADKAESLARTCESFGAWAAVQPTDIQRCANTGCRVLSQHVDPITHGAHTGSIMPEAVRAAGAWGTLLNHSEKRLERAVIEQTIKECKQTGLAVVLCAESVDEAESFLSLEADYIAVELPELIGGDVSIVSADPNIVKEAVERLGDNVIVGAGVNSAGDIARGVELGVAGFLPSSAVVKKTDNPAAKLEEFYSTLR